MTTRELAQAVEDILTGKNELSQKQAPWMVTMSETELLKSRIDSARKLLRETEAV
jgi:hypothetical protein